MWALRWTWTSILDWALSEQPTETLDEFRISDFGIPQDAQGQLRARSPPLLERLHDLFNRSAGQNPSGFDNGGRIADLRQLRQDVRADQHGLLEVDRQQVNQFAKLDAGAGIEPGG